MIDVVSTQLQLVNALVGLLIFSALGKVATAVPVGTQAMVFEVHVHLGA